MSDDTTRGYNNTWLNILDDDATSSDEIESKFGPTIADYSHTEVIKIPEAAADRVGLLGDSIIDYSQIDIIIPQLYAPDTGKKTSSNLRLATAI